MDKVLVQFSSDNTGMTVTTNAVTLVDQGGDGKIPFRSVLKGIGSGVADSAVSGIKQFKVERSVNKAGVVRVLLRTVMPGLGTRRLNDGTEIDVPADVTVHMVLTVPKAIADALMTSSSAGATSKAAQSVGNALQVFLQDLASVCGYQGSVMMSYKDDPDSPGDSLIDDVGTCVIAGVDSLDADYSITPAYKSPSSSQSLPSRIARLIQGSGLDV